MYNKNNAMFSIAANQKNRQSSTNFRKYNLNVYETSHPIFVVASATEDKPVFFTELPLIVPEPLDPDTQLHTAGTQLVEKFSRYTNRQI